MDIYIAIPSTSKNNSEEYLFIISLINNEKNY